MFDGINAIYKVFDKDSHFTSYFNWERLYYEATGLPVNDDRNANFEGLRIALKPSVYGSNFHIKGSLHKWHNEGTDNADQFTFSDVCHAVKTLCQRVRIEPEKTNLQGLEIGVNIALPYPVIRLLKNLVSYKGKPFTQINKRKLWLGVVCSLTDYELKFYDKGRQAGKEVNHLLRMEIKAVRIRPFADIGLTTLADLTNKHKAYSAKDFITGVLNSIIWTDTTSNKNQMPDKDLKQWQRYENPLTWQGLKGKHAIHYAKQRWNYLLKKHGTPPDLLPLFLAAWERLFIEDLAAQTLRPFPQLSKELQHKKFRPFPHLDEHGKGRSQENKTIAEISLIKKDNMNKKSAKNKPPEKRHCITCKKDISHQRPQSVFCSALYVGEKQAKRCRNKDSDNRRSKKRTIQKAGIKKMFVSVTYHDGTGKHTYTDILQPDEIDLAARVWIDRIVSISIVPAPDNVKI